MKHEEKWTRLALIVMGLVVLAALLAPELPAGGFR